MSPVTPPHIIPIALRPAPGNRIRNIIFPLFFVLVVIAIHAVQLVILGPLRLIVAACGAVGRRDGVEYVGRVEERWMRRTKGWFGALRSFPLSLSEGLPSEW
jgi:hypothetical protein